MFSIISKEKKKKIQACLKIKIKSLLLLKKFNQTEIKTLHYNRLLRPSLQTRTSKAETCLQFCRQFVVIFSPAHHQFALNN